MSCISSKLNTPTFSSFNECFKKEFIKSNTFRVHIVAMAFLGAFLIAGFVALVNGNPIISATFYTNPAHIVAFCGMVGVMSVVPPLLIGKLIKIWNEALSLDKNNDLSLDENSI